MSESSDPVDVFFSYSRKDSDRLSLFVDALGGRNWNLWWDRKIPAGQTWDLYLRSRIVKARCLLVLWSKHSTGSDYVKNEVRTALESKVPVIAVGIDRQLELPLDFKHIQATDLAGWKGDVRDPDFGLLRKAIEDCLRRAAEGDRRGTLRRALVVGAGEFDAVSELPGLQTARRNVEEIGRVLSKEECGYEDVELLVDPDCRSLQRALEALFASADLGEQILLYYFGHAALDSTGEIYLCATDTEPGHLMATAVSLPNFLKLLVNRTKTGKIALVLDCCYLPTGDASLSRFEVQKMLFNQLGRGRGMYLLTATTRLGQEVESSQATLSRLCRAFVEGLESGEADANDDRIITAEEITRFVQRRLAEAYPEQRPEGWALDVNASELVIARRESGPSRPLDLVDPGFLQVVRPLLQSRKVIPFLGNGIYGGDSMSSFALSRALLSEAGLNGEKDYEVATAAQYLFEGHEDRDTFLAQFRKIIEDQSRRASAAAVHELVLKLGAPLLVISSTYDYLLEERLETEGIPFTVVAHVLHSRCGERDGHVLVLRRGAKPSAETCLSDQFIFDETREIVIYKVLGSPFLHDLVDPEWKVDTVVATENDYMDLLTKLKDDSTTIPTAFSIPFNQKFLVFLGYTLDLWHYRLVAQIFRHYPQKKRYAVRQPVSPIEARCWEALDVRLYSHDPASLAELLLEQGI